MRLRHGQPLVNRLLFALLLSLGPACTPERSEPAPAARQAKALEAPAVRTALLGLELGRDGKAALAFAEPKEFAFAQAMATVSDANVRVEVFSRTGVLLGVTEANVTLCSCPQKATHYEGDVEVPHETMVLLKVPFATGDERVRVSRLEPAGPGEEPRWREALSAAMPGGDR